MKQSSIALLFFAVCVFAICAISTVAAQGGYSVDLHPLQNGTVDYLGSDRIISFFELPLWIQLTWIGGSILAIFSAIKFGPLVIVKVKTILQNKNRTAILDYIGNNPGCTLADLSKQTGINHGTTKYHLYMLLIERKIVRKKGGKRSYLFTNGGIPLERKQVYGYMMNPSKREILYTILEKPGISNKEIADRLQLGRSTVHWHLQQFLDEKIIMSRWDGKSMNYVLNPEVEDILRENRK